MTKAVVDLGRGIMAVDAEWHADLESLLLEDGSAQEDLWGINLMLLQPPGSFVVYTSLINLRPAQGSFAMEITDPGLRSSIMRIVEKLVDFGQSAAPHLPLEGSGREGLPQRVADILKSGAFPDGQLHTSLTLEKWRANPLHKRLFMVDNELGRAQSLIGTGGIESVIGCYERALELVDMTVAAAHEENAPAVLVDGLQKISERIARLHAGMILDEKENSAIRGDLIALDPEAYRLLHQGPDDLASPSRRTAEG
jgi:hypothetical protein